MLETIKQMKMNFLMTSVAFIIFGIVLLVFPGITGKAVFGFLGVLLMIIGAFCIIRHFVSSAEPFARSDLFTGLLLCAVGLFCLLKSELIVSALVYVFGIIVLISGFFMIQSAVDLKKFGYLRWWGELTVALITSALGLILLFNPFEAAEATIMFIGASLIFEGIAGIVSTVFFHSISKSIKKDIELSQKGE